MLESLSKVSSGSLVCWPLPLAPLRDDMVVWIFWGFGFGQKQVEKGGEKGGRDSDVFQSPILPKPHFFGHHRSAKIRQQTASSIYLVVRRDNKSKQDECRRNETGDYPSQRGHRYISGALRSMFSIASIVLNLNSPSSPHSSLLAPLSFLNCGAGQSTTNQQYQCLSGSQ